MGCDGGTIPKRHELVKTAKRGEQKDKDMDRRAKWTNCTINQQALTKPIMICALGRLYSKESLIQCILDRSLPESCSHITSMKNVRELKLTTNSDYGKEKSGCHDQYFDTQRSEYVCPVVGVEMNGKYKFCALWSCGCVLSERALKEVDTDNCHKCGSKFQPHDVIVVNAEDDDLDLMKANIKTRREMKKAIRNDKKARKGMGTAEEPGPSTKSETTLSNGGSLKSKSLDKDHEFEAPTKIPKRSTEVDPKRSTELDSSEKPSVKDHKSDKSGKMKDGKKRKESSTSSSKKQEKMRKQSSQDGNGASSSSGSSSSNGIDPKQSSVYKKLFTSGVEKKSSDQSAHWITYNPYHL